MAQQRGQVAKARKHDVALAERQLDFAKVQHATGARWSAPIPLSAGDAAPGGRRWRRVLRQQAELEIARKRSLDRVKREFLSEKLSAESYEEFRSDFSRSRSASPPKGP